ncbi:hypothetical protein [Streptomyces sp. NBC_00280]|uniref:hypothetical protein n=1 Tax=Streptomyces sp. NBC_00280 TaxID=2975699 RepID=UPI002F90CF89
MTVRSLDACCLLLTLLPALPSVMTAVAYQQARHSQPHAGFRADEGAMDPESCAPVPAGDRESRAA